MQYISKPFLSTAYQFRSRGATGTALLLCEGLSGTLADLEGSSSVASACGAASLILPTPNGSNKEGWRYDCCQENRSRMELF